LKPEVAAMATHKKSYHGPVWFAIACFIMVGSGFLFYYRRNSQEVIRVCGLNKRIVLLNKAYGRFVPQKFVTLLGKGCIENVSLGDQVLRDMVVMFFDVVNFTAMVDCMSPEETIGLMNKLFAVVQPIIAEHNGIINKFLGDGAMVIFSSDDDAVAAAIKMLDAVDALKGQCVQEGSPPVFVGIGIDSGPLMAGIVGDDTRMEFTAYGNAVNVAARIERLTRTYGVMLLVTEHVYDRLGDEYKENIRIVDHVHIKGKTEPVAIYELFSGGDPQRVALQQKTLPRYVDGFNWYLSGKYKEAIASFEKVLCAHDCDKLVHYQIKKCKELLKNKDVS
jgi:class 3 adenylate cyclase